VAREHWEKAVTLRPNYAEANFMLGELLQKYKRLESAKDHYARALQQDPSQPIYYVRLGGTYILLGNFEQALVVFQRAAERFSQNADMHYFVALAARGAADYERAEAALRKSLSLQPNHVDALALLGAILSDRGDTAAAEKFLRRAIALNDKHFNAYHDLGRLLVRIRRYSEALPVLQRAATLQPTDADVHYQLYVTLSRLKRNEEADRELTIHKRLTAEQRSRNN
jgi:tetratricopeptide (TPR) repeat protein